MQYPGYRYDGVMVNADQAVVDGVPCPLCGAAKGSPCRKADEFEAAILHVARIAVARAAGVRVPQYMDNPKAAGAPEGARWGYLPCGCVNDGFGRHHSGIR